MRSIALRRPTLTRCSTIIASSFDVAHRTAAPKSLSALIHTAIYAGSSAFLSGDGPDFAAQAQGPVH